MAAEDADDGHRRRAGGRRLRGRHRRVRHNDQTVRHGRHQDHSADIADGRPQDRRRRAGRPPTVAPDVVRRSILGKCGNNIIF